MEIFSCVGVGSRRVGVKVIKGKEKLSNVCSMNCTKQSVKQPEFSVNIFHAPSKSSYNTNNDNNSSWCVKCII